MGALLPSYKTSIINALINGVNANTSALYAFASNPVAFSGNTPAITLDDYHTTFFNNWQMLFGKRVSATNIIPIIRNIQWTANTVYAQYDNTDQNLLNENFYVIVPPSLQGGPYTVFKCIANANDSPSTQTPTQVQPTSFTLSDGYTWRYITTISNAIWQTFNTPAFAPIVPNTTISTSAFQNAGVENCVIVNGGNGYSSYSISNTNLVLSVSNSTIIQIQNYESTVNNFYAGNAIYLFNAQAATSQIFTIAAYVSNSVGNFVTLNTAANTTNISPSITQYLISPQVVFTADSNTLPVAYTTINTTSNSIQSIVLIDTGAAISWCNVAIVSNTSAVVSNAIVYAIVPPAGGHGFDPSTELFPQGMGIAFTFANSEGNTIPTNITYNQIGLLMNPNTMNTNGTSGTAYTTNTFSQVLQANLSPSTNFAVGNTVTGVSSGALGTVAFCNGTNIYLTGDKHFISGETIVSSNGVTSSQITINTLGQIYTTFDKPLYIQNIANIVRSNTGTESYKLIVAI